MPKWTVTGPDGKKYPGIEAATQDEAIRAVQGQTPSGAPATKPSFLQSLQTFPSELEKVKTSIPKTVKQQLLDAGWDEARAEQQAQKVAGQLTILPTSWREIGTQIIAPLIGSRFIPKGAGRIGRAAGGFLGTLGTAGGIGAASETAAPTGQGPLGAGLQSALQALPSAAVTGGVAGSLGANKATIRAQQALSALKQGVSPGVAARIDPSDPQSIFSGKMTKDLLDASRQPLDTLEASLGQTLAKAKFALPQSELPQMSAKFRAQGLQLKRQPTESFQDIRDQIKDLRDIGNQAYSTPEARGKAKDALQRARTLEQDLLGQMRAQGFSDQADQYKDALRTHARDRVAIRTLQAFQKKTAIPGGANPVDNPALADAADALYPEDHNWARQAVGAMYIAMRHPGIGAHYLSGSGRAGPLNPRAVAPVVAKHPANLAGLAGALTGGGMQTGTGVEEITE